MTRPDVVTVQIDTHCCGILVSSSKAGVVVVVQIVAARKVRLQVASVRIISPSLRASGLAMLSRLNLTAEVGCQSRANDLRRNGVHSTSY